jgi:hypothetical protein
VTRAGEVLVQGGQLHQARSRRWGQNEDDLVRNFVSLRGELRSGLAVAGACWRVEGHTACDGANWQQHQDQNLSVRKKAHAFRRRLDPKGQQP